MEGKRGEIFKVANPMGERMGSYSFVSPEGEVVEVSVAGIFLAPTKSLEHDPARSISRIML